MYNAEDRTQLIMHPYGVFTYSKFPALLMPDSSSLNENKRILICPLQLTLFSLPLTCSCKKRLLSTHF